MDRFVIDAVAHAYDFSEANRPETTPPDVYRQQYRFVYDMIHVPLESREPGFLLDYDEFCEAFSADAVASLFFEESDVDMFVYHAVDIVGLAKYGTSPWEVGVELKRRYPDRVLLYAPADPFAGPAGLEAMEQKAAEAPIDGFKFYPSDGLLTPHGKADRYMLFDDPVVAYPFIEKAGELGVKVVAIHKAVPVGPGQLDKDRVDDVSTAALAFPDMTFEIVHSGWAFLEDTALQLALHPNIWANLEAVSNFATLAPRRFLKILGKLIEYGGSDRIVHASGAVVNHPNPMLEAIEALEMPQDLLDEGLPQITDEIKTKLLGANLARLHGIDIAAQRAKLADDEWSRKRAEYRASDLGPWHRHRAELRERGFTLAGAAS